MLATTRSRLRVCTLRRVDRGTFGRYFRNRIKLAIERSLVFVLNYRVIGICIYGRTQRRLLAESPAFRRLPPQLILDAGMPCARYKRTTVEIFSSEIGR